MELVREQSTVGVGGKALLSARSERAKGWDQPHTHRSSSRAEHDVAATTASAMHRRAVRGLEEELATTRSQRVRAEAEAERLKVM